MILPGASLEQAGALAERLREGIRGFQFPAVGRVTVSLGVAEGPRHASSPRELIACADLAMREAKASGKDCVRRYSPDSASAGPRRASPSGRTGRDGPPRPAREDRRGDGTLGRKALLAARGEDRPVAQLRMLQSLSARLNHLNDVRQIGEAITTELRSLIDYHNCRVFLLQSDGQTLVPIAFRGELSEYRGETFDALLTRVGEGLTGHVALTGESRYAPDANLDPYAVTIPGTRDLDESLLGVPMKYGDRVIGVVVLSKLGIDQFDQEDVRLLEALASSAAVAFENARLLQAERELARTSSVLLRLSQGLTRVTDTPGVLQEALAAIPTMIGCGGVEAWIRDPATGDFHLQGHRGFPEELRARLAGRRVPAEAARPLLRWADRPFVLSREEVARVPAEHRTVDEPREVLVAPLRWEPDGLGALTILADGEDGGFSERDVELARGIADITSLALGNARRFDDLQQAYVSTVEALAGALEAKDRYTEDHCRALAEMAMAVGAEVGLPPERLRDLELGALFHDIGKIGVPSEILRKPGPLTAAERRAMNRHPVIGADILAPVPFLRAVRPIVRASHERWDGKGYPDGLAGEAIPLESRIVFVCDAFHAMTTDRPYRAALPEREAIRRLKLAAGTQFDPSVVEAFVRLHAAGRISFHPPASGHPRRTA